MGVLDELERMTREPMRSDDDVYTAIPEPGLGAATIDAIELRIGAPLPADLRTLLGACHGIRGLEWEIDFTGSLSFEMDHVFPHGLPILGDHAGNFWVVDCTATPESEAAIFFACHDPPVMLWQCRGMATVLRELRRKFGSPATARRASSPARRPSGGRASFPGCSVGDRCSCTTSRTSSGTA